MDISFFVSRFPSSQTSYDIVSLSRITPWFLMDYEAWESKKEGDKRIKGKGKDGHVEQEDGGMW